MGLRAVAVVVGGAGVAVAAGWTMFAPAEIDRSQVESDTLAQVAAAPSDALHCNGGLKARIGAEQSCTLTRGGENFAVALEVTDVEGERVNWNSVVSGVPESGLRVPVAELEQRTRAVLARQRPVDRVTCQGPLAGVVGARQSCVMIAHGIRHPVTVTATTVGPTHVQWGVTVAK